MGSFAKSFEESFKTGAAIGSAGALETMKEKIKKENETAKSSIMIGSLQDRILQEHNNGKITQEEASAGYTALAKMKKSGLESTEVATLAKLAMPNLFDSEKTKGPKGVFVTERNKETGAYQVRNAITGEVVTDPSKISSNAEVMKETMPVEEYVSRITEAAKGKAAVELETQPKIAAEVERAKEEVRLDYPDLDEKSRAAVSAYKFISPRVNQLKNIIDLKVFGDDGLVRLAKQITVDKKGDLIVPDGSPLESVVGLYNDIKLTGFNIAGTAFTGTEKETAFALLNPVGKSDDRIKRDLDSFVNLFATRIESGVGGMKEARKILSDLKLNTSIPSFGSEEEAIKAGVKKGDKIIINGVSGTWE